MSDHVSDAGYTKADKINVIHILVEFVVNNVWVCVCICNEDKTYGKKNKNSDIKVFFLKKNTRNLVWSKEAGNQSDI